MQLDSFSNQRKRKLSENSGKNDCESEIKRKQTKLVETDNRPVQKRKQKNENAEEKGPTFGNKVARLMVININMRLWTLIFSRVYSFCL